MSEQPNKTPESKLHPRNKNRASYDLQRLVSVHPSLSKFIITNKFGNNTINFSDPKAVKQLNIALLKDNYGLDFWDFDDKNLCPPIPGRADYLHYIADLLSQNNGNKIPTGQSIKGLDIGTGATLIYPIIGTSEYSWSFLASDVSKNSIESSQNIIEKNTTLNSIELRWQNNPTSFFKNILSENDGVDFTMCNPPFHANKEEATKGTNRKIKNLTGKNNRKTVLNFAGATNELIYEGGEIAFIDGMLHESKNFAKQCLWFTTLVSKEANLPKIESIIKEIQPAHFKIIPMATGNKITRIIAWTFLSEKEQKDWVKKRWSVS